MARNRDQAIALRRWEWSETSQTVLALTREHGLIRGLAKGARRERGAFSGGFEPLTRGELLWIDRRTTELALLTEWDLREVFQAPRRNLRAHHAALYMAEVCQRAIGDADPHPGLWFALLRSLRALDDAAAVEQAALRFQWAVLAETGAQPDLGEAAEQGARRPATRAAVNPLAYDPSEGRLIASEAAGADSEHRLWRIRAETVELLRQVRAGHIAWRASVDPDEAVDTREVDSAAASADAATALAPARRVAIARANRFLAACLVWTLEGDPPASLDAFLGGPVDVIHSLRRATGASGRARSQDGPADRQTRR